MSTTKNGASIRSRYQVTQVQSENRMRYSQNTSELGGRTKLPMDISMFVMAVEIERLVQENNQLKSDLQQSGDSRLDRIQYESQIRDLMAKLQQSNSSKSQLLIEVEQLQKTVQEQEDRSRKSQLSSSNYDPSWRAKLSQAELQITTLQSQLNEQISKLGGQHPDQLMRELEELRRKRYQYEEIQKNLNGRNINDLIRELDDSKRRSSYQEDSNIIKSQLNSSQSRIRQLEEKLQEANSQVSTMKSDLNRYQYENSRLTQSMSSKIYTENSECSQLRNEITKLNAEISKMWSDNETLVNEIDQLRTQLRGVSEDELRRLRNEVMRLQEQNNSLALQNAQLQQQIMRVQQENQQLQSTIEQYQYDLNESSKQRYSFEEYKEKIRRLEISFQELQLQNEKLKQSDHRMSVLNAEIERLNFTIQQLTSDSDEWKQKFKRAELALLDYRQIEKTNRDAASKNEILLDEIERLKKILEQKQYDMDHLMKQYDVIQSQINTYQTNINTSTSKIQEYESNSRVNQNYQQENERIKEQLYEKDLHIQQLERQIQEQNTRNQQLQNQQSQIQQQKQQQMQSQYNNPEIDKLKRQIFDYENKIAMLSLELTRVKKTQQNNDSQCHKCDKAMELLAKIAIMSAELDSLRGFAREATIYNDSLGGYSQEGSSFQQSKPANQNFGSTSSKSPYSHQNKNGGSHVIQTTTHKSNQSQSNLYGSGQGSGYGGGGGGHSKTHESGTNHQNSHSVNKDDCSGGGSSQQTFANQDNVRQSGPGNYQYSSWRQS